MISWIVATIMFLAGLASGTYLVVTEHYGWAWIPFLLAACTTITGVDRK